jgi:hypothetical protein
MAQTRNLLVAAVLPLGIQSLTAAKPPLVVAAPTRRPSASYGRQAPVLPIAYGVYWLARRCRKQIAVRALPPTDQQHSG